MSLHLAGSYIQPFQVPSTIQFDCVADRALYLLVPKDREITKAILSIRGEAFKGNVALPEVGTTFQPESYNKMLTSSLIIDFHTPRTIDHIVVQATSPDEYPNSATLDNLVCVLRVWGGTQWFLPSLKNLFPFNKDRDGIITSSLLFPKICTEKVLLTFAFLKKPDGGYVDFNTDIGKVIDDYSELASAASEAIEEKSEINILSLKVFPQDYPSNLSIYIKGQPPFWLHPKEFATPDKPINLPDFSQHLNTFIQGAEFVRVSQLAGLPDEIREKLNKETLLSQIPIIFHTDTSGILKIEKFDLEYLILRRDFRVNGDAKFSPQKKTVNFSWDESRTGITSRKIEIEIPSGSHIKHIAFSLKGSLAKEQLISLDKIVPKQWITFSNFGARIGKQQSLAQKIVLLNTNPNVISFDLRLKMLSDIVKYRVELSPDQQGIPSEEVLAFKEMEYQKEKGMQFSWVRINLDQVLRLQPNQPYWLVLTVLEGQLVWQMNFFEEGNEQSFVYSFKKGDWNFFNTYLGKPVGGIFRIYHLPEEFIRPPALEFKVGNQTFCSLTTDPSKIDLKIDVETNFQSTETNFILKVNAKSPGSLSIADLLVKYQEAEPEDILGYLESPCRLLLSEIMGKRPLDFLLDEAPLTILDGIGEKFSSRLNLQGIFNIRALADLRYQDLSLIAQKVNIPLERLQEFVSKAILMQEIVNRVPSVPLPLGTSFERIRQMSEERIRQVIKVDSATARRIIEDFEILFAITDETGIKKSKMKYF